MRARSSVVALVLAALATAQEPQARVRAAFVSDGGALVGQRMILRIELLSSTGFAGTPRFEFPEIPGVVVARAGNPVVSSDSIDGETWGVQMHDFALFAQRAGEVVVPGFGVFLNVTSIDRMRSFEREVQVEELRFEATEPPGGEGVVGLVTGRNLSVEVDWQPRPSDDAVVGDAFVRTVAIRMDEVLGMALPPMPVVERDGLAVHGDRPVVEDRTARGAFTGLRTERTTYVCESPGRVEVPEVVIRWFDLDAGAMAAATVEGVAWSVAPAPVDDAAVAGRRSRTGWWIAAVVVALGGVVMVSRRRVSAVWSAWRLRRAESEPAYFRRALAACRSDDAGAALREVLRWLDRATAGSRTPRLRDLVDRVSDFEPVLVELEGRALDGGSWKGRALAAGLRRARAARLPRGRGAASLPPLNPRW